jgi:hypothetical protein
VDVGPLRQRGRVDLHHRAHHHDLPVGMGVGQRGDEPQVQPFVDHAVVAQARMGQGGLRRMIGGLLREVRGVDAARKTMHVGMPAALGFIQARPAGEDQVGRLEQYVLALHQLARRVAEGGEFVHAVVDDAAWREACGQRKAIGV